MISVCILTKNGEETIRTALDSVRSFPEVILLDSGSTDRTIEIASSYPNVRIHTTPFTGFGSLRNRAARLATHDWILGLDCDEALSPPLVQEIQSLSLDPAKAYSMPRRNYYRGKWIKGCGWHPDRVIRLYNRKTTCYGERAVHESIATHALLPLRSPLLHTPCRSASDFLRKIDLYSTLFAEERRGKRPSSLRKAALHSAFAFLKSYLWRRGFLDGAAGFAISLYNANATFYKYLKLDELNQDQ